MGGGDGRYLRGVLWFLLSLVICQCNDVAMKFLALRISPPQITLLRNGLGAIWLFLPMACLGKHCFHSRRIGLHISRGCLLFAAMACWCLGLRRAPLPTVVVIGFSMPLFLLVLARIFLGERASPLRWSVTLLGVLGVALMARPGPGMFNGSVVPLLVSAVLFSSVDILNRRFARSEPMWPSLFYTALATALCSAIPAAWVWKAPTPGEWAFAIFLGAGSNLLFFCLLRSLRLIEASATAPYRYLEFLFSLATGYVFFGELAPPSTFWGAAIIIPTTLFLACYENSAAKGKDIENFRPCC
jgi:drug/metabolite transporter (DMT)-like permease